MGVENWANNRPNEEQLIEKRNEYIDEAVQMVASKKEFIEIMTPEDILNVTNILKEKQGINENASEEAVAQFHQEYNNYAITERFHKYIDEHKRKE